MKSDTFWFYELMLQVMLENLLAKTISSIV